MTCPLPPEDLDAFDVKAYVQNLHPLFARRNGWSVTMEQPFIGLFTFAKVVIYEDMLLNEGEIAKHPVLRAMAGDPTMLRKPSQEADLGEPDPLRTFQVLDADSSQMDAIEAVKRGDNLVLQGPPGTGKSQTITNIIAETLAQGRTVLFVSEKMAALEVVKRRLDQCGLGDHCLELHSTAPNKQEVLGSMLRPLQATDAKLEGTEEYRLNQLKGVRNELNSYLLALHRKSSPLGMSAFQAHGELASLYDHQQLVFDFKEPFGVDQTRLDRIVATLRRLAASREVVSKREQHPWRDLDLKELSLAQQGEMLVALEDLDRSSDQLDKELAELCGATGLARPQDVTALRRSLPLLQMAARSPSPPSAWFDRGKIKGYREDVAGWRSALVTRPRAGTGPLLTLQERAVRPERDGMGGPFREAIFRGVPHDQLRVPQGQRHFEGALHQRDVQLRAGLDRPEEAPRAAGWPARASRRWSRASPGWGATTPAGPPTWPRCRRGWTMPMPS